MRALFGAEPVASGTITVDGREVSVRSPKSAVRLGFGFAPEERKEEGIVPYMTVAQNISIASMGKVSRGPFVSRAKTDRVARHYVDALRIVSQGIKDSNTYAIGVFYKVIAASLSLTLHHDGRP